MSAWGLRAWLAGILAVLSHSVWAIGSGQAIEQLAREHWGVAAGLPNAQVRAIAQDRSGYLWMGTFLGLARFDGNRIRIYRSETTPALPASDVRALHLDAGGRLWIGTDAGVAMLERGVFRRVESGRPLTANGFAVRSDGSILVATLGGVYRSADGISLAPWSALVETPAHSILATAESVWIGIDGAIVELGHDGQIRSRHVVQGASPDARVRSLAAHRGEIWAGTASGLFRLRGGRVDRPLAEHALAENWVWALTRDSAGNLWMGTSDGLVRMKADGKFESISKARASEIGEITAVFEDREGSVWIGSIRNGITRLRDNPFGHFGKDQGLYDASVSTLGQWRDGKLLVGTVSGVSVFDGTAFGRDDRFAALDGDVVLTILQEREDTWIGTATGLYHEARDQLDRINPDSATDKRNVFALLRDRDGVLWVGGRFGLAIVTGSGLKLVPIGSEADTRAIHALVESSDGTLYAVANDVLFERKGSRFERVELGLEGRIEAFASMLALPGDDLVLGTQSATMLWRHRGRWHRLGEADGLPSGTVVSFALDHHGNLWVAGAHGLYRLPIAQLDAYVNKRLPLLSAEQVLSVTGTVPGAHAAECCWSTGSNAALVEGEDVWVMAHRGVMRVPVAGEPPNPVVPVVRIERARVGEQWHDLVPGAALSPPLGARDLEFEFTVLSLRDPKAVRLKYRLVGYDKGWRPLEQGGARRAGYTNLPPGSYAFQVMGANDSGRWNESPESVALTVPPTFLETDAFKALLVIGAMVLMLGFVHLRTWALARDRARLETLASTRTHELKLANQALLEASQTDPLTGLKNRRYLFEHLPAAIAGLHRRVPNERRRQPLFGFAVIDIDLFKAINDSNGHEAGDMVLRHVATTLRGVLGSTDFVIRWGGDEIVLVLRGLAPGELAQKLENARLAIEHSVAEIGAGQRLPVTISMGAVEYPVFSTHADALGWQQHIELADLALYDAKRAGRNTWAVLEASPDAAPLLERALLAGPRSAAALLAAGVFRINGRREQGDRNRFTP